MKKSNLKREKEKDELALFRYSIIAPLINNIHDCKSKSEFFRNAAIRTYTLPNGKTTVFAASTIKSWYLDYCKMGFDSLKPKLRNDSGFSRTIPLECRDKILALKEQFPHITGKAIYSKLVEDGDINACDVSLASLYRFMKRHSLYTHHAPERKAFEMQFSNDCWQADTSHGPIITLAGKKVQTYLIQIIDDASRLIVGYQFFLNDNAFNFQLVLKQAIKTYGVPKKLFVDNGKTYKNHQLKLICATAGIALIYAKVYSPESKAKVERAFRTVKDNFINCTDWSKYDSLEDLNDEYREYIVKEYNSKFHSGINDIPRNRFQRDYDKLRFVSSHEEVDKMFLHLEEKRVAMDSTIRVACKDFEVPQKYIRQKILIKYSPDDLSFVYIYDNKDKSLEKVFPVDKIANSKIKRKTIHYS